MQLKRIEITSIGIFSGLAYAGGLLFIAIPNVEIFTAIIFLSGILLGPRNGIFVGIVAQTCYSILNPYGISPFPLLVTQVMNRALVGFIGGQFSKVLNMKKVTWSSSIYLGVAGLTLAWLYDVMTFFTFAYVSGFNMQQMNTSFVMGLPFYLIHGAVNMAIFALVLPALIKGLSRLELLNSARLT